MYNELCLVTMGRNYSTLSEHLFNNILSIMQIWLTCKKRSISLGTKMETVQTQTKSILKNLLMQL